MGDGENIQFYFHKGQGEMVPFTPLRKVRSFPPFLFLLPRIAVCLSKIWYPNLSHVECLVIIFLGFRVVLLLLLCLPLADLARVGLLAVQVGENKVKDFRVPAYGVAFNAFLDGLYSSEKSLLAQVQKRI